MFPDTTNESTAIRTEDGLVLPLVFDDGHQPLIECDETVEPITVYVQPDLRICRIEEPDTGGYYWMWVENKRFARADWYIRQAFGDTDLDRSRHRAYQQHIGLDQILPPTLISN